MKQTKKVFKMILILIWVSTQCLSLNAQDAFISCPEFKKIKINDLISLEDLYEANGNWQPMINAFGETNEESCSNSFVGTQCIYQYNGIRLNYNDYNGSFEMLKLEISNSNYKLYYNNSIIKVGDNIDILEPLFQDAYANRRSVNFDGNTRYFAMLRVGADSMLRLVFNFDILTGQITSIELEE